MSKMVLKQESRLNGVKTNVFNCEEVAGQLRVPFSCIMKYFASELGSNLDKDTVINGKHEYDIMLKHLDKFIEKYVICQKCRYPELMHSVQGKDLVSKCNSCGSKGTHDSTHKAGKQFINQLKKGATNIKRDISDDDEKTESTTQSTITAASVLKKPVVDQQSDEEDDITLDSARLSK